MLLLSGFGNPTTICQDLVIPPNTNYQMVGPQISISESVDVSVSDNSNFTIV